MGYFCLDLAYSAQISGRFSLEGLAVLIGLFAIFGLFTDEHNLKNDTLAFEHAQVGRWRWKPLHFLPKHYCLLLSRCSSFHFGYVMPALSMVYSSRPVLLPPQNSWALTAFAFGALFIRIASIGVVLYRSPSRTNSITHGAVKPNLWQ